MHAESQSIHKTSKEFGITATWCLGKGILNCFRHCHRFSRCAATGLKHGIYLKKKQTSVVTQLKIVYSYHIYTIIYVPYESSRVSSVRASTPITMPVLYIATGTRKVQYPNILFTIMLNASKLLRLRGINTLIWLSYAHISITPLVWVRQIATTIGSVSHISKHKQW